MIKVHIFEPFLNTHLFNLIHLIFHQMHHIKDDLHDVNLHFLLGNVFLQKYRHVCSAPGKQLEDGQTEEQETVALEEALSSSFRPRLIGQLVFVYSLPVSGLQTRDFHPKVTRFYTCCSPIVPHGLYYILSN